MLVDAPIAGVVLIDEAIAWRSSQLAVSIDSGYLNHVVPEKYDGDCSDTVLTTLLYEACTLDESFEISIPYADVEKNQKREVAGRYLPSGTWHTSKCTGLRPNKRLEKQVGPSSNSYSDTQ